MNGAKLTLNTVKTWVRKNAPTLVMGAGIGCYAGAAAFTVYGTVKATKKVTTEKILRETSGNPDGDRVVITIDDKNGIVFRENAQLTKGETFRMVWKYYIPAAIFFAGGTALVITANHMQLVRIELLAAAYAANSKKFEEYKAKVNQVFGEKANDKISHEQAKENVFINPPPPGMGNGNGALLFMDSQTGQYFYSTRHVVDQAITECDRMLMADGRVSVNDLLYRLGCPESKIGENYGWDSNDEAIRNKGIFKTVSESIHFDYVTGPNDEPVCVLKYEAHPFISF